MDSFLDRFKRMVPSRLREKPMGPIQPSDYEIIEFLVSREKYVKGTDITKNVSLSQSQVYKRCNELADRGILEHKSNEGYRIVLGKKYFPVHLLLISFMMVVLGTSVFLEPAVSASGLVFALAIVADWYLNGH